MLDTSSAIEGSRSSIELLFLRFCVAALRAAFADPPASRVPSETSVGKGTDAGARPELKDGGRGKMGSSKLGMDLDRVKRAVTGDGWEGTIEEEAEEAL